MTALLRLRVGDVAAACRRHTPVLENFFRPDRRSCRRPPRAAAARADDGCSRFCGETRRRPPSPPRAARQPRPAGGEAARVSPLSEAVTPQAVPSGAPTSACSPRRPSSLEDGTSSRGGLVGSRRRRPPSSQVAAARRRARARASHDRGFAPFARHPRHRIGVSTAFSATHRQRARASLPQRGAAGHAAAGRCTSHRQIELQRHGGADGAARLPAPRTRSGGSPSGSHRAPMAASLSLGAPWPATIVTHQRPRAPELRATPSAAPTRLRATPRRALHRRRSAARAAPSKLASTCAMRTLPRRRPSTPHRRSPSAHRSRRSSPALLVRFVAMNMMRSPTRAL